MKTLENLKLAEKSPKSDSNPTDSSNLSSEKSSFVDVFANFTEIVRSSLDDDDEITTLPALDEVNESALVSHSIVNYLGYLDSSQLSKLSKRIYQDTQTWITDFLLKFTECLISYHTNNLECLIRAIRLALLTRFPDIMETGLPNLPPISIYVSESYPLGIVQQSCRVLGLPQKSIKIIKCCANAISVCDTMDCGLLQVTLAQDTVNNEVPLICIANMGTNFLGHIDDVASIREISSSQQMWLHLSGNASAAFVNMSTPQQLANICDSMEVQMDCWLDILSISNLLLHKPVPSLVDLDTLFCTETPALSKLKASLNLWLALGNCGKNLVLEKVLHKFSMLNHMYGFVNRPGIRILSKKPPTALNSLASNIGETAVTTIVFQFDGWVEIEATSAPEAKANEDPIQEKIIQTTIEKINNSSYYDRLNNWLFQTLLRDFPNFQLDSIEHSIYGTCLRFSPFEFSVYETPQLENFQLFAEFFENQVDILRATVKQKAVFTELVENNPLLKLVELHDWAGLGGVLYIPEGEDLIFMFF